jgi:hypothetical protein
MCKVCVAHVGKKKRVYRGNPEVLRSLGRLDIDGRIILKWTLGEYDGGCGLDSSG